MTARGQHNHSNRVKSDVCRDKKLNTSKVNFDDVID